VVTDRGAVRSLMTNASPPNQLDRLVVDDIELEYRWIPAAERWAPTIVFLHEGLGSAGLWRDFPDRLCQATGCAALIYSRQGHGASSLIPRGKDGSVEPDAEYLKREADEVLPAVMTKLGIARAILLGHSDGATIALMFAARNPDRALGCIVEAPHVMVEEITIKGIKRAGKAFASGDLRDGLAKYHEDPEGIFLRWFRTWTHPNFSAWNMLNRLPDIKCPILGIQGENDEYGSFEQLTTIRDSVPAHTDVMGIKNCHHTPHSEFGDLVIDRISRFLPHCR
jgi:pimeloyl-ACP methyl ester carboxylesterase